MPAAETPFDGRFGRDRRLRAGTGDWAVTPPGEITERGDRLAKIGGNGSIMGRLPYQPLQVPEQPFAGTPPEQADQEGPHQDRFRNGRRGKPAQPLGEARIQTETDRLGDREVVEPPGAGVRIASVESGDEAADPVLRCLGRGLAAQERGHVQEVACLVIVTVGWDRER